MLESVPWAAISGLTPAGLLSLAIWMILSGRLVPRSFHDIIVEAKERWREAAQTAQKTVEIQAKTIEKQTTVGESVIKVMGAVQDATHVCETAGSDICKDCPSKKED